MTNNPEEWSIVSHATSLSEARRLEDLQNLALDMLLVIEFLKKLVISGADDPTAQKAYFTAALITYRRCFTTGVRSALADSDAEPLPSNAKGTHAHVRAQANKLAAHSVNPFDQTRVGIMVREGKTVAGVGSLTGRLMNLSGPEIIEWGKLAEDILEKVLKPRIQAATMELDAAAKKLSIKDITRAPILGLTIDPLDDPNRRRD